MVLFTSEEEERPFNAQGFAMHTRMLEVVFGLSMPPPRMQQLGIHLNDEERAQVEHFVATVGDLLLHTTFNSSGSTNVSWTRGEDIKVTTSGMPTSESVKATMATFRQVYAPGESPSFRRALNAFKRAASYCQPDQFKEVALFQLRYLAKVEDQLKREHLRNMADEAVMRLLGHEPPTAEDLGPLKKHMFSPEEVIDLFGYGAVLHSDPAKKARLDALKQNDFEYSHASMEMLKAMRGLLQLYVWFAGFCTMAMERLEEQPPGVDDAAE